MRSKSSETVPLANKWSAAGVSSSFHDSDCHMTLQWQYQALGCMHFCYNVHVDDFMLFCVFHVTYRICLKDYAFIRTHREKMNRHGHSCQHHRMMNECPPRSYSGGHENTATNVPKQASMNNAIF